MPVSSHQAPYYDYNTKKIKIFDDGRAIPDVDEYFSLYYDVLKEEFAYCVFKDKDTVKVYQMNLFPDPLLKRIVDLYIESHLDYDFFYLSYEMYQKYLAPP